MTPGPQHAAGHSALLIVREEEKTPGVEMESPVMSPVRNPHRGSSDETPPSPVLQVRKIASPDPRAADFAPPPEKPQAAPTPGTPAGFAAKDVDLDVWSGTDAPRDWGWASLESCA